MIRLTGSEWKRFYADPAVWPSDAYWEDALVSVDGVVDESASLDEVADTAVICVDGGDIIDGEGGVPSDLEDAITWWRAKQTTSHFQISLPNDQIDAMVAALAALGITANQVI